MDLVVFVCVCYCFFVFVFPTYTANRVAIREHITSNTTEKANVLALATVRVSCTVAGSWLVSNCDKMVRPLSDVSLKNGCGGMIADGVGLDGANRVTTTVVVSSVLVVVSVRTYSLKSRMENGRFCKRSLRIKNHW